jgi:hypothetical protein
MNNLKDLLERVKQDQVSNITGIAEMEDEEEYEGEYEGPTCYYLNEDGTCSDGCSCSEVEVEQECPFLSSGDFESCCCYEESYSDSEDEESEDDYEEDSKSDM